MHDVHYIKIVAPDRQKALRAEAQRQARVDADQPTQREPLLRRARKYLRDLLAPPPKITIHNGRKRVA